MRISSFHFQEVFNLRTRYISARTHAHTHIANKKQATDVDIFSNTVCFMIEIYHLDSDDSIVFRNCDVKCHNKVKALHGREQFEL